MRRNLPKPEDTRGAIRERRLAEQTEPLEKRLDTTEQQPEVMAESQRQRNYWGHVGRGTFSLLAWNAIVLAPAFSEPGYLPIGVFLSLLGSSPLAVHLSVNPYSRYNLQNNPGLSLSYEGSAH